MKLAPVIIIDTREQNPWEFADLLSEPGSLATGDYSVKGLEHLISIERKSLDDLLGCIGAYRKRFKRELQRLRAYRFRCLVIEATYEDLERGGWRSRIHSESVLGSLAAWQAQYSLPVFLAGDHDAAARFARRYLFQCAKVIASESAALGQRVA